MINKLGYVAICLSLRDSGIFTGRTMTMGSWKSMDLVKRMQVVNERAILNLIDLQKILEWNVENDIHLYRITSSLFPLSSEYNLSDLPYYNIVKQQLFEIGSYIKEHDLRVGFHPGPFNVLASPKTEVVRKAIHELNQHSEIFNLMELPQIDTYSINIHVGGAYGDKKSALHRFIESFKLLNPDTQKRLVVENDDKKTMYTVKDLYTLYESIGTPITFDFHHHWCSEDPMKMDDALDMALATWNGIPLTHFSSCRKLHEDDKCKKQAHADYLYEDIPNISNMIYDVEIEAKMKDLALLKYRSSISI